RRVNINESVAKVVSATAERLGIKLTAHASYYINLNSREPEKVEASKKRLFDAAYIGSLCGAESIIFHPGYYMGDTPEKAYDTVKSHLEEVLEELRNKAIRVKIRPELMGGVQDIGTMDDIINLSAELEGVAPGIDFSHWHARTGKYNSYDEFASLLEQIGHRLGQSALDDMHIHVSGIMYGAKGEIEHLNLEESDLQFGQLMKALKDFGVKGVVICESPRLEEDALILKKAYEQAPV
ncbi:TIM barrel protein, partial [Chloroflexota bacterium]